MSQKRQQQNETMTPMQHRAVLVCILCVLAVLLTFGITTTLLKKGGEEPAPSVSEPVADPTPGGDLSGHYQIDNASTALLTETADAGTDYLNDTLFLGDSNTVRLYNNGLISLQQFCAKEGIGTQVALNEGIVTFKRDSNHYTIPQAVAMMKPRRVVIMLGTNDVKERFGANAACIAAGMERLILKAKSVDCWGTKAPNILVVAPPRIGDGFHDAVMGEGCVEKSKGVAEQFRIVAERQNVHFLNAADCEFNQVDFMHLTRKGHAQLADLLAKEVPTLL